MSRLLFAAARGARIQYQYSGDVWLPESVVVLEPTSVKRRIHPEDEHLAYGPISSALRAAANEQASEHWGDVVDAVIGVELECTGWRWMDLGSLIDTRNDHRMNFLLILAEALADEGL